MMILVCNIDQWITPGSILGFAPLDDTDLGCPEGQKKKLGERSIGHPLPRVQHYFALRQR